MIRIGIIGCGGIANGRHITELSMIKECKITALCDTNTDALKKTAARLNLDAPHCFTDYKALVDCADVDAVEICTPNYLHVPMAEYAVTKGKPINVEKPLALKTEDTQHLEELLTINQVPNMMCFSYRFFPAVRYAKSILDKGLLGQVVSVNVEYLKSSAFWEGRRLDWRFIRKYAGTGVLGDLGVHLIDMAQLLVGDIRRVSAVSGIVVKQRQRLDCDELADVETDDYCNFIADITDQRTGEIVPATFVISRCALGHANTIKYNIFGTDGVLSFNLNNPEVLDVCIGEVDKACDGLHTVRVPAKYKITQEQMFIDLIGGKKCEHLPSIADGVKCQRVLDAILESATSRTCVEISPCNTSELK